MSTLTVASRGARARAVPLAAAAVAAIGMAGGCTTSLGNGTLGGYDKSTLIALSDPVMGMTVAGNAVYWIDDTGSVWSCDAVGCNDAPKRMHAGTSTVSSAVQLGVSGDWLFWVIGESLFGCPTSGCPAGALTALATSNQSGGSQPAFAIDTAGGTGAYWVDQASVGDSGVETPAVLRYSPDCASGCPETVFQAPSNDGSNFPTTQCDSFCTTCPPCTPCTADSDCPAGQFCTTSPGVTTAACSLQLSPGSNCNQGSGDFSSPLACAFGTCENSTCPQAQPTTESGIAIAGGNVYFVSQSQHSSILSCPVSGCSLSTLSTYWTSPAMGGQPTLYGAGASALYFSSPQAMSDDLESCSVPTCAGAPVDVASSTGQLVAFSPTDFYIVFGGNMFGGNGATACPLSGCPSGSPTITPDPSLDSTPLGVVPNARPFAVDGTAIVWATSAIFGQPGNQIVRTPAP
jgi:Cys-rich repeat protein